MSGTWKDEMLAWKAAESVTLRRALAQIEQAALRFLAQPFSRVCRDVLRAQLASARRDVAALVPPPSLATSSLPPEIPAATPAQGDPLPESPNLAKDP